MDANADVELIKKPKIGPVPEETPPPPVVEPPPAGKYLTNNTNITKGPVEIGLFVFFCS